MSKGKRQRAAPPARLGTEETCMRKTLLAAVAAMAIFTLGAASQRAAAMTLAAPSQLGLTSEAAGLVQKAAWHCGPRGCARWHRQYWGWPFPPLPWIHIYLRPWPGPWFQPYGSWGWRYHHHHWHH